MVEINKEFEDAARRSFEGLKTSSHYLGLFTKSFSEDPLCMVQLGYAVLHDKPIYLMVEEGTLIPESLKKIAKGIGYFKRDKDTLKFKESVNKLLHQISKEKRCFGE